MKPYSVMILALVLVVVLFALWFAWGLWLAPDKFSLEDASALGSSSGVLSTLFSGLAFWGVVWTLLLQRIEGKRERITQLLLDEADHCVTDMNAVEFTAANSRFFSKEKPFGQWVFFYKMERVMVAGTCGEIKKDVMLEELAVMVSSNHEALKFVYDRLNRSCDVARYLLADSEMTYSTLNELKFLFFSRFNKNIFVISQLMTEILQKLLHGIKDEEKLFHPLQDILDTIGSINEFKDRRIDESFVRSWSKLLRNKT